MSPVKETIIARAAFKKKSSVVNFNSFYQISVNRKIFRKLRRAERRADKPK